MSTGLDEKKRRSTGIRTPHQKEPTTADIPVLMRLPDVSDQLPAPPPTVPRFDKAAASFSHGAVDDAAEPDTSTEEESTRRKRRVEAREAEESPTRTLVQLAIGILLIAIFTGIYLLLAGGSKETEAPAPIEWQDNDVDELNIAIEEEASSPGGYYMEAAQDKPTLLDDLENADSPELVEETGSDDDSDPDDSDLDVSAPALTGPKNETAIAESSAVNVDSETAAALEPQPTRSPAEKTPEVASENSIWQSRDGHLPWQQDAGTQRQGANANPPRSPSQWNSPERAPNLQGAELQSPQNSQWQPRPKTEMNTTDRSYAEQPYAEQPVVTPSGQFGASQPRYPSTTSPVPQTSPQYPQTPFESPAVADRQTSPAMPTQPQYYGPKYPTTDSSTYPAPAARTSQNVIPNQSQSYYAPQPLNQQQPSSYQTVPFDANAPAAPNYPSTARLQGVR